jgi:1A family penicillin-binding protein
LLTFDGNCYYNYNMKYFVLTITFLFAALALTAGFLFYSSYTLWLKDKEGILERLSYLKGTLAARPTATVSLAPDLERIQNTVMYDRHGRTIGEFATGKRKILAYDELPPLLLNTVVLMEDETFATHKGFYLRGFLGAAVEDIRTLSFSRGGSTITQQLAKNLFTDNRKTVKRKIYELFCTFEIEKRFDKRDILSLYLNSIYFGHYNYGVGNASGFYFNKEVFQLNLYEVALLAGMIPNPGRFSPLVYPERCRRKQRIVLNKLIEKGIVEREAAIQGFDRFWEGFRRLEHQPNVSIWSMEKNRAPYFVEYVRQELDRTLGSERIRHGGLSIYTSLDLEFQNAAEESLWEGLKLQQQRTEELNSLSAARAARGGGAVGANAGNPGEPGTPEPGTPGQPVQGAFVALHPRTGYILAMVGGRRFTYEDQFNRAVTSRRQIGSAFKPFVFAAAVERRGYGPETRFVDKPLVIRTPGGVWKPSNYKGDYFGNVTLEFALVKSLNSVAVQLVQDTGPEPVIDIVGDALDMDKREREERFQPHLSLALGVYSFSPLEIARAYSIFPNMGEKVFPLSVLRVEDASGSVLVDNEGEVKKGKALEDLSGNLRVIDRSTAATLNGMMSDVLKKEGTAYRAITTSGLVIEGAGKTGTTNDYTDAWFVGYTRDVLAAVWVGFDNPKYSLGEGQAGGVVAAPIWASFMKKALWRE